VTAEHDRFVEQLAAYVLESLAAEDRAGLEAHVAGCAACVALLAEYRAVVGTLPIGLDPVAPPARAWETIRARARSGRRQSAASRAARWASAARWPAVAALVLVLAGWNVTLQRELARRAPGPAPGPEVEALSRRPGRIVILKGTGQPAASARIFVAVDGGGHLAVSGLDTVPAERVYQLWFVRAAGAPVSGATFRPDGSGRAWVKVAVPTTLDDVDTIVVTEETAPGTTSPTGTPLLTALPWR